MWFIQITALGLLAVGVWSADFPLLYKKPLNVEGNPIDLCEVSFCYLFTRVVFHVHRVVDLMKISKINAYIMYIYLERLSFNYTCNLKLFQNALL